MVTFQGHTADLCQSQSWSFRLLNHYPSNYPTSDLGTQISHSQKAGLGLFMFVSSLSSQVLGIQEALNKFLMSESLSFLNALTVNCGEPYMQNLCLGYEGKKIHRHPSSFAERGKIEPSTAPLPHATSNPPALFFLYIYYPFFPKALSCYWWAIVLIALPEALRFQIYEWYIE